MSITDRAITLAIKEEILSDERVPAHLIDIEANEGIAVSSDSVHTFQAKERAVETADTIKGVQAVVNQIEVKPATRADDEIYIVVSCHNGLVYLSGVVSSNHEKFQTEDIAGRVRGMVTIENKLKVDQTRRWKSDEEIKQEIQERFQRSAFIEGNQITVAVQDGIATLTGAVEIWQKRNLIVDQAFKGGAKSVLSRSQVSYGATEPEEKATQ